MVPPILKVMNLRFPLTLAALLASLAGTLWLYRENASLRGALHGQQPPPLRRQPPAIRRDATAPPFTAPNATAGPAGDATSPQPPKVTDTSQRPLPVTVAGNNDGSITVRDPVSGVERQFSADEAKALTQQIQTALAASATRLPNGPSWSPGQAAGPPNTNSHGDYSTAWASQSPDGGKEWLKVKYAHPVDVGEINIHESYNPGAISKVSVILPDGSPKVIWEGTETPEEGIRREVAEETSLQVDQLSVRYGGVTAVDSVTFGVRAGQLGRQ